MESCSESLLKELFVIIVEKELRFPQRLEVQNSITAVKTNKQQEIEDIVIRMCPVLIAERPLKGDTQFGVSSESNSFAITSIKINFHPICIHLN
jgi:hypothetical protein